MTIRSKSIQVSWKEVFFQIALHLLVFVFYAFERKAPHFELIKIPFYLQYAVAAFFINYFLLPRFYYRKKPVQFFIGVFITVLATMLMEELVLEPIFSPRKAGRFPGIIFTLAQILPVIAILSGFKFAWDALGKQREVEELRSAVRESELQFLKSQINPHFLFNNLNNLYSYALENSPKTPEIILELAGFFRYMLYECKEKYVPLSKEAEQLENFVKLSEMQIEERGNVSFSTGKIPSNFQIAPLILPVFTENAFKHSTASQADNIFIEIRLDVSETGELIFLCKNSFQPQSNTDNLTKGIGLKNVRKRLDLLYPDVYKLEIRNEKNVYEVRLSLDLKKQDLK